MSSAQIQVILIAASCTGAVGTIGVGAIWLLRRASLRLALQASSAVAVLAVVAGTLGTANAMFISQHDLGVVGMVCVVAGLIAFGFSWLLGRQVEISSMALRRAARSLGQEEPEFSAPAGPMAAEPEHARDDLVLRLAEDPRLDRLVELARGHVKDLLKHRHLSSSAGPAG